MAPRERQTETYQDSAGNTWTEEILERWAFAVHIPMFGVNSSMNVAASLWIALYEWHRRYRALIPS